LLSLGLEDDAVIRQINADPLLPDEMIDATARREMISAMAAYNELGSSAWSSFRRADPGCVDSDRA
jgi:phenylacetic acid degradation operon negative regulatory protein